MRRFVFRRHKISLLALGGIGRLTMPNIPMLPATKERTAHCASATRLAKAISDMLFWDADALSPPQFAVACKDPLPVEAVASGAPRSWLRVAERVWVLSQEILRNMKGLAQHCC